ncbi:aspartate aminotransferase family protein [Ignisphaera sp. 4213-co]|uniref:Aspartate aminotransferase family protein n=1 Tax=Ignisphaera cupida TaxID=3050454 RepID=A0ABD4Z4H9_9CREN|nr:aspartate aminotransferase family protein [Ignisphaera sp. 4213-co]MDK6027897.1 aspartate aminotransferase family protein [Ignisphaera sp. 4213-co]
MMYARIEERLVELSKELVDKYFEKTAKSKRLFERASKVLPAGVTYSIRWFKPYPIFIEKAEGVRVWDVDGNSYVDFWMGHGTHILGHKPEFVIEAVKEVLNKGTHLGYENPYAVEYAELLTKVVPGVEMIRFTNSGTEANMYALRLARAYTKRKYVVKIEGGWHGGYDALHKAVTYPFTEPESAGLPEEYLAYTIAVPFNDVEALEKTLKSYSVAAIVIEPVLGAGGSIEPVNNYLKEVRRLAYEHNSLLIFDEVITGFRLAPGGAQEYFGVKADLVVFGKIVGGGFAGAGAFGGRAEVMELIDHMKYPSPAKRSFHGGTFVGNPVNMVTGKAMVEYLVKHRDLYEKAERIWSNFRRDVTKLCEETNIQCWTTGVATMIGIHFTTSKPKNVREVYELRWSKSIEQVLHLYMRTRGILYMKENLVHLLPSLIHTEEEAKLFKETLAEFLTTLTRK